MRYNLQRKVTMMKNKTTMAEINITEAEAIAEIEKVIKKLEAKGKIAWTGEWRKNRNGKLGKVYVAVEFIKKN